jgi:hypothetical protein
LRPPAIASRPSHLGPVATGPVTVGSLSGGVGSRTFSGGTFKPTFALRAISLRPLAWRPIAGGTMRTAAFAGSAGLPLAGLALAPARAAIARGASTLVPMLTPDLDEHRLDRGCSLGWRFGCIRLGHIDRRGRGRARGRALASGWRGLDRFGDGRLLGDDFGGCWLSRQSIGNSNTRLSWRCRCLGFGGFGGSRNSFRLGAQAGDRINFRGGRLRDYRFGDDRFGGFG